jgi:cytochrome c oxidase subunit 2
MYTVVPIVMVLTLFYFTNRDTEAIKSTSAKPDVNIEVVAKQWSWDFNYQDSDVYDTGQQAQDVGHLTKADLVDGVKGTDKSMVTLWLPVDKEIRFTLTSRDVDHSFWVPAFLYKEDVIPGHPNVFEIKPLRKGVYAGKCAELCGEWHSSMIFNVRVVSETKYQQHLAHLRTIGQTGQLSDAYNRDLNADLSGVPEGQGQ